MAAKKSKSIGGGAACFGHYSKKVDFMIKFRFLAGSLDQMLRYEFLKKFKIRPKCSKMILKNRRVNEWNE